MKISTALKGATVGLVILVSFLRAQSAERPLIEKYEKEFNENGLDRVDIRRDN